VPFPLPAWAFRFQVGKIFKSFADAPQPYFSDLIGQVA
jgi:hypothetical protein